MIEIVVNTKKKVSILLAIVICGMKNATCSKYVKH